MRRHGPGAKFCRSYDDAQLKSWARKCRAHARKGRDVFPYFDNDEAGHAAFKAQRLVELANKK